MISRILCVLTFAHSTMIFEKNFCFWKIKGCFATFRQGCSKGKCYKPGGFISWCEGGYKVWKTRQCAEIEFGNSSEQFDISY